LVKSLRRPLAVKCKAVRFVRVLSTTIPAQQQRIIKDG
jgi:hypothetical protein